MSEPRILDVAAVIETRRLTVYSGSVLAVSMILAFFEGLDMLTISYTAPYLVEEFGLAPDQLGRIFAAGMIGMVVGGVVFGMLGDRFGRKPGLVISALALGSATLLFSFADGFQAFVILRFVVGLSLGGLMPLLYALNIELVPSTQRATVTTLILVGLAIGSAIAGPLTVWVVPPFGWRALYVAEGAATIACAGLIITVLPESPYYAAARGIRLDQLARTLNALVPALGARADDRFVVPEEASAPASGPHPLRLFKGRLAAITPLLWLGFGASYTCVQFIASWAPIVFEHSGLGRATAAYSTSAMSFAGALVGLGLMRFTDRLGPSVLLALPIASIPLLLALGLSDIAGAAFIMLSILAGMLVKGAHYGISSILGLYYPSAIRSNGIGWATGVAKLIAVLGSLLGAAVLSRNIPIVRSYAILALCPAILALSVYALARLVRRSEATPAATQL